MQQLDYVHNADILLVVGLPLSVLVQLGILCVDTLDWINIHCEYKLNIILRQLIVAEDLPVDVDLGLVRNEYLLVEQDEGATNFDL